MSSSSCAEDKGVYVSPTVVASAVNAISRLSSLPKCVAIEFSVPSSSSLWFVRALRDALRSAIGETPERPLPRLAVLHDSRCCPGIVAAQRIQAELILHFGPTCCCFEGASCPVAVLPNPFVKYDEAEIASRVCKTITEVRSNLSGDKGTIIVAVDGELNETRKSLKESILKEFSSLTDVCSSTSLIFCHQHIPGTTDETCEEEEKEECGFVFAGWRLPGKVVEEGNCGLVYVGSSRSAAFSMEASVPAYAFRAVHLARSDSDTTEEEGDDDELPSEMQAMFRRGRMGVAMRRSRAIEDVRNADSLGLLQATPAHADASRKLRELALSYGIGGVTPIAMDRITEYKLANFPDEHIGVFVVVACPYTLSYLEAHRYDRPVVSAAECVLALTDDDEWVSHYTTDTSAALSRVSH